MSRTMKNISIFLTAITLLVSTVDFSFSVAQGQTIDQMCSNGYNQEQADRLLGCWSRVKHCIARVAAENRHDNTKLQVIVRICRNRHEALEEASIAAIKKTIESGREAPLAIVATGGGRKASAINSDVDPYTFIINSASSDLDETIFGKISSAEYASEQTHFLFAERALGRKLGRTPEDYRIVNQMITNSEVTVFARNPAGVCSQEYGNKFPSVLLESYRGPEGQASLDVGYLVRKETGRKGAHIVKLDKNGNFSHLLKDQPSENVIKNLSAARFSTLQRLSKSRQDYWCKYLAQIQEKGLMGDDQVDWAAKMLARMSDDELKIAGRSLVHQELYEQAIEIREALKDPIIRADRLDDILGEGRSLDDFVQCAEKEMKQMDLRNKQRLAWMLDDDIGKPIQGGRVNVIMKGMVLLTNAYIITDAYVKSHKGDRVNQMSKALVSNLAADLAGSVVGQAVGAKVAAGVAGKTTGAIAGGAAGFASGAVAGAIAIYVVNGTWEWTEEGAKNLLRGYKGDQAVEKMFLSDKEDIKDFVNMSPDEIKKHISKHWNEYMQYSGAYKGKGTDNQSEIKQYMLEKAIEHQFLLKKGQLEGEIRGNIFKQELEKIVKKMDSGQLTPEGLEKIRAQFGKNTANMIQNKLMNDPKYAHYKKTLDVISKQSGKPGLWDRLKSNYDTRSEQQIKDDINTRFQSILEKKELLEGSLAEFYWSVSKFFNALNSNNKDADAQLAGFFNQSSIELAQVKKGLSSLQTNVDLFLSDLAKSSGRLKDTSDFNYQKGEAGALLALVIGKVNGAIAQFAILEEIMGLKQKVDEMLGDSPDDADHKDNLSAVVKKSKDKKKDDIPGFVKKSKDKSEDDKQKDRKDNIPGFVNKSREETIDDYVKEFNAQKDDYSIQAIAIETVDIKRKNKIYNKIKDIDSAAVIIRIRGNDHIIDGYNALSLLIEKGYVYLVEGVGYVTSEKFDNFTGEEDSSSKQKTNDKNVNDMDRTITKDDVLRINGRRCWPRNYINPSAADRKFYRECDKLQKKIDASKS